MQISFFENVCRIYFDIFYDILYDFIKILIKDSTNIVNFLRNNCSFLSEAIISLLFVCWIRRNFSVVFLHENHAYERFASRKNYRKTFRVLYKVSWTDTAPAWAKAAIKIRWFQPTAKARSSFVSSIDSCALALSSIFIRAA